MEAPKAGDSKWVSSINSQESSVPEQSCSTVANQAISLMAAHGAAGHLLVPQRFDRIQP